MGTDECYRKKLVAIRKNIPHKIVHLFAAGEGDFLVLEQIFFFFLLPGLDWLTDGNMVLVESGGDIMLECGLSWGDSALTGELRTVVGWVTLVLATSRSDILTKFKPVGGVPALVMGLDGVLSMSQFSAAPTLALELILSGLLAAAS